jgi:glycosyltransferase involved in cell wall biosynthesis
MVVVPQKIILITSGQPSLNPRLVKEADALADAGYEVTVIYQYWNKWATDYDKELLSRKRWSYICVGGNPFNQKLNYLLSRILHKAGNFLAKDLSLSFFAEMALGRCTSLLTKKAKSIKGDLYIAHNLAAIPAAVKAALKNKAKSGFDAEDFHRYETSDDLSNFDVQLKTYIENKYIGYLNYLSTSSTMISNAYQKLYPKIRPYTILNVFPKQAKELQKTTKKSPLKFFWFSQTIGINRGLETVIKALGLINGLDFELHLLGDHDQIIQEKFNQLAFQANIETRRFYYHLPISPNEICDFAAQFDIGFATEMSIPYNRDICLTNKIFTYLQSGLAIIASDTTAQRQLLEEYPDMGMIYEKKNPESLARIIQFYAKDRNVLIKNQRQALQYG